MKQKTTINRVMSMSILSWSHRVMSRRISLLLTSSAIVALIGGCATRNSAYQDPATGRVTLAARDKSSDNQPYRNLRAIEFDEQGDLFDRRQRSSALSMIRSAKDPLLIVFIHGWHNNAAPDCQNLQSFNRLLHQLDEHLQPIDRGPKREVVGVYIGWRGLAIGRGWDKTGIGWLARYLSFFSRHDDTDRVAGIPLQQTLCELSASARAHNGRVVFVGHSFGARILEKITGQILVGQTSLNSKHAANPPADLTLLLNSASEAIYGRRLKVALQEWPYQTPAIVSITSEGDTANGVWWPAGMRLASLTKQNSYREYHDGPDGTYHTSQFDYVCHTSGHSEILRDRKIKQLNTQTAVPENPLMWNLQHATTNQFCTKKQWYHIKKIGTGKPDFLINGKQTRGYWVISAPVPIIKNHDDIFNDSAIDLFAAIYRIRNMYLTYPRFSLSFSHELSGTQQAN